MKFPRDSSVGKKLPTTSVRHHDIAHTPTPTGETKTRQDYPYVSHRDVARHRLAKVKVKVNEVQQFARRLTATATHMPYGITQCYLPPGRCDIPALIPVEAGTRLSDPGGCKAELTYLAGYVPKWCTSPKTATHPGTNRARRGWVNFVHTTNAANHYATPPTGGLGAQPLSNAA